MLNSTKTSKQAAANAAAELIEDGMSIGLGTGSTAEYFIERLITRCQLHHLKITVFPSSQKSAEMALAGGIPLCNENQVVSLDLTVDGADEVDPQKRLIKGGGGALLREKIVAAMSKEMIVIIDQNKLVERLGGCPLPVEIVPFGHHATMHHIRKLQFNGEYRLQKNGKLFVTDNGNYIIDVTYPNRCHHPEKDALILKDIPGVVETGFFFQMAGRIIVGQKDGSTTTIN